MGAECHILFSAIGWSADALEANSVMEEEEGDCLIMEEERRGGEWGRDILREREVK